MQQSNARTHVDVTADELPVHCPMPETSLWNSHPMVYIPLEDVTEAACPYCGTIFRRVTGKGDTVVEGTIGGQVAAAVDAIGDSSLTSSAVRGGDHNLV